MNFVHLRVHTEYSLTDSIIKVNDLVSRVTEFKMPAVGVTELQNLFSTVKVYSTCLKMGVKPIIGVETRIENKNHPESPFYLVLLCLNIEGYCSLCKLVSQAHKAINSNGVIQMNQSWLNRDSCDGLIALSAAQTGEIGQRLLQNKPDDAKKVLEQYQAIFKDRFYLEISRIGGSSEAVYEDAVLDLAESTRTPIVATHQPRFLNKEEFGLHEVKVCIQDRTVLSDSNRRRDFTDEQYFRSSEEMSEIFSDLPGALENACEIAKRCNLKFDLNKTHMPAYPQTIEEPSIENYLEKLSREGLRMRLNGRVDEQYENRLTEELDIIRRTNYAGYFLIVADIIKWAKSEGIPVGPGRGSGAGSLVAYCLDITTVDPIEHDLIFERFLNPDRVSPPDFDIDFCVQQRDRVIEHVSERYGRNQVAQIITYNTMAARAAVRDVGRAIKPDYLFYDELARLIPQDLNITLARSLEKNSELRGRYQNEPRVKELFDTAQALEGMIKNVSKHPGGIVIAPSEITNFSALFADSDSGRDITHFDKDDLEAIGLVKFDFLGLTTLTIITHTLHNLNANKIPGAPDSENAIPMNDKETYDKVCSGQTVGIFQLESRGMQRLIHAMQPREFKDLVALLAIYRPGPLQTNMDQMYINNQRNKDYKILHQDIKEILDQSHGVILYQEQVMKIAQIMSGYTLGEADILRYAMGKKVKKEMQIQRKRFVNGAVEKGYSKKLATEVYDLMESFAGYGFNKSHSVAYAILAYRTAYLKTHYCAEFLAACMTVDMKVDTIVKIFNDAKSQKIKFISPDINRSVFRFKPVSDNEILYGLGALKQIGYSIVQAIEEVRENGGLFKSLPDFCQRVDLSQVSKSACQVLISAGAFDSIDSNRARLFKILDSAYGYALRREEEKASGQMSLFGNTQDVDEDCLTDQVVPWSKAERLRREYSILGLYVSGHPFERYESEFKTLDISGKIAHIRDNKPEKLVLCGWVTNTRIVEARKGGVNLFFDLQDSSGEIPVAVYSETYEKFRDQISENQPIVLIGSLSSGGKNSEKRVVARNVYDVDSIRKNSSAEIILKLQHDKINLNQLHEIKNVIAHHSIGNNRIKVQYLSKCGASAQYSLDDNWSVEISDTLLDSLHNILGEEFVSANYSNVRLGNGSDFGR